MPFEEFYHYILHYKSFNTWLFKAFKVIIWLWYDTAHTDHVKCLMKSRNIIKEQEQIQNQVY